MKNWLIFAGGMVYGATLIILALWILLHYFEKGI